MQKSALVLALLGACGGAFAQAPGLMIEPGKYNGNFVNTSSRNSWGLTLEVVKVSDDATVAGFLTLHGGTCRVPRVFEGSFKEGVFTGTAKSTECQGNPTPLTMSMRLNGTELAGSMLGSFPYEVRVGGVKVRSLVVGAINTSPDTIALRSSQ